MVSRGKEEAEEGDRVKKMTRIETEGKQEEDMNINADRLCHKENENDQAVSTSEREALEEQAAFIKVIASMGMYESASLNEVERWERQAKRLPQRFKADVGNRLHQKAEMARSRISLNQKFLSDVVKGTTIGEQMGMMSAQNTHTRANIDITKPRYVLKNVYRDWSVDGQEERRESYGRIIGELKKVLEPNDGNGNRARVLVPGAGLGRLVVDTCLAGYKCEGCEWSYYMLLISDFILNRSTREGHTIFPWVLETCNIVNSVDQFKPIQVPDFDCSNLSNLVPFDAMSMSAGDFIEVYSTKDMQGQFDAVLTSFFIDTAQNIAEYIEVLRHCLRPGGFWINLGPLLYHWVDSATYMPKEELSVELSLDDVIEIVASYGFSCQMNKQVESHFVSNKHSMARSIYNCAFFTMVRGP